MRCSRCGREGETEYGSDGQAYCNSCVFYGLNKPCFRCRMYLPASELQQYKGQWVCPYCIMDMRDEDRRMEESAAGGRPGQAEGYVTSETCERCGRQVATIYYFNGRRLCVNCIDEAKREWKDTGGEKPPLAPLRVTEKAGKEAEKGSFMEWLFANLLGLLGIRKREKAEAEVVALRKPKVLIRPLRPGKPLENATMAQETGQAKPMAEGLEKKTKKEKRQKRSQDITFAPFLPEEAEKGEAAGKGKKEAKKKKFGDYKSE